MAFQPLYKTTRSGLQSFFATKRMNDGNIRWHSNSPKDESDDFSSKSPSTETAQKVVASPLFRAPFDDACNDTGDRGRSGVPPVLDAYDYIPTGADYPDEFYAEANEDHFDNSPGFDPQHDDEAVQSYHESYPGEGDNHAAVLFDDVTAAMQAKEEEASKRVSEMIIENLNPAQADAVTKPLDSVTRVLAGPGSGKTKVLTCRIAYLLQQHPQTDRILAVTFTKKAAGEMNSRLEQLLKNVLQEQQQHGDELDEYDQQHYAMENSVVSTDGQQLTPQEQRLNAAVQQQLRRVTLGTFHSVCARILRANAVHLNSLPSIIKHSPEGFNTTTVNANFAIADQTEQLRIVKEISKGRERKPEDDGVRPISILNGISLFKEEYAQGRDPFSQTKMGASRLNCVKDVYDEYRKRLFASNQLDFDDLIYLTRELLIERRDTRESLQRRWTHLLVDEFQDTSVSQLDLVQMLTTNSLFVVGDADQSIYSWRGAHVGMMHEFVKRFQRIETVYLMENYRSTSNIVRAAQKIISSGSQDTVEAEMRQDMKPLRGAGPPPRVWSCMDDLEEAAKVIGYIKKAFDLGDYPAGREVAILYRTNAQSRNFEEACVKHNLAYVMVGSSTSFYNRREIKDCLSFLKWLANGRDQGSMERAVSIVRGIGPTAMKDFDLYYAKVISFYEQNFPNTVIPSPLEILIALTDNSLNIDDRIVRSAPEYMGKRSYRVWSEFSENMASIYRVAKTSSVEKTLKHIIDKFELEKHIDKYSSGKDNFEERKQNINELLKASQRYTGAGPALGGNKPKKEDKSKVRGKLHSEDNLANLEMSPLATFMEDVSLVTETAADAPEKDKDNRFVVLLMTIHAAKGLEFDTVFVVGNEEGTFPTMQAISDGPGSVTLEEEKRLCYVAMTRAKTELVMTWRKNINLYGGSKPGTRSRYLDVLAGVAQGGNKIQQSKGTKPWANQRKKSKTPTQSKATQMIERKTSKGQLPDVTRRGTLSVYDDMPSRAALPTSKSVPKTSTTTRKIPGSYGGTRGSYSSYDDWSANGQQKGRRMSTVASTPKRWPSPETFGYPNSNPRVKPSNSIGQTHTPFFPNEYITQKPTSRMGAESALSVKNNPSANAPKTKTPTAADSPKMDSTWFFPIGSEVQHKQFGRGIVLPPPRPSESMDMPVLVKFSSGQREIFSARGNDISPGRVR